MEISKMKLEFNIEMSEKESLTYFAFMKDALQSMIESADKSHVTKVHEIAGKPLEKTIFEEQQKPAHEEKAKSQTYQPTEREIKAAAEGQTVFAYFVEEWSKNFGVENSEQPDRAALLNQTCNHSSLQILSFLKMSGGLTNAVIRVSNPAEGFANQTEFIKHCRMIAENIAQVSSILFPPLAEFLEYPFQIN